jgi:hypothetical protein
VFLVVPTSKVELAVPPATLTVDGLSEIDIPAEETVEDKATDPVNPLSAVVFTVALPDVPANSDRLVGLLETVKSSVDNFHPVTGWISQWPEEPPCGQVDDPQSK